jgi:uncharacterized membrane protein HdeD (DUF308 family)
MNTVSRTVTGTVMIILGILLTVLGIYTVVTLFYGIPILILGIFLLFNDKEDKIERIKYERRSRKR